jgi:hypothetical protein
MEKVWILSSNKDMQVTQYQPIRRNDILGWVMELLDGNNKELGRMDALIKVTRQSNWEIQTALPRLGKDYEGLIISQGKILNALI